MTPMAEMSLTDFGIGIALYVNGILRCSRRYFVPLMVVILSFNSGAQARERLDLPSFDRTKAQALTPEKHAEYERLLFNEISYWNAGSPRHDLWSRQREWLQMANDGYELAYIALQVVSPTQGTFAVDKPLRRLSELAERGDAGAMCLAYYLVVFSSGEKNGGDKKDLLQHYMIRGAEKHHPACLALVGARTLEGLPGFVQDKPKGFRMLVETERQKYDGGALELWGYFRDKGLGNAAFVTRQYCWGLASAAYSIYAKPAYLLEELAAYAKEKRRPDLLELSERLGKTTYTVEDCVNLGLGE